MAWTTFHHRSSYECSECKKALCIYPCFKRFHTLTMYKAECTDAFHSLPQVPVCRKYRLDSESKNHVHQQNAAEGTRHLVLGILPLLRSSIYPPVAVHVSHNGCRRSKTKPSTANKLYICQQTYHLSLSTTIFCHCQQTSSVAVNKLFNCCRSLNQFNSNHLSKNSLGEAKKCSKEIINQLCILCYVLCIVCCVSQYCFVPTIKCKFFQQHLFIFS